MSDVGDLIRNPTEAAARDLSSLGGILVCFGCNDVRPVGASPQIKGFLEAGWPMCCGETMQWITAEQLGGSSTSPLSGRALDAAQRWLGAPDTGSEEP